MTPARRVRDAVRTQLWPIPTLTVILAVLTGLFLPRLDAQVDGQVSGWVDAVLFDGDASPASTVLDAVASSLMTVTSLTFSLTVITLQLASSQYSPRLLRTFTQDVFLQGTLAVFLATLAYALTVLRSLRGGDQPGAGFTPRIAVTTAYGLAVLNVVALVLFLAHLTRQIRVKTILAHVRQDADKIVRSIATERERGPDASRPRIGAHHVHPLHAPSSGFLVQLDTDGLKDAARAAGATVVVTAMVGEFV